MEQSSKILKTLLGILLVVFLAALVFVFLSQKELFSQKTVVTPAPIPSSQADVVKAPLVETEKSAGDSATVAPSENQKQITTIQDQLNAGTLSAEEAVKQMNALAPPAPPLPPTEVKR